MTQQVQHGSCVDLDGKGVLILGPSGSGKSTLALQLIAAGATLVADDQVTLERAGDAVVATRPPTLPPLIEARGLGLLKASMTEATPLHIVIEMGRTEADRLPPPRHITLLGFPIPLFYRVEGLHFGSAVAHLLRHGRSET